MSLDPHNSEGSIILSSDLLEHLKAIPPAALRVYIYLCASYKGQPFSASVEELKGATGREKRAVIAAVGALCKYQLVTRTRGRGHEPDRYEVLFPPPQFPPEKSAGLPTPESDQATEPEPISLQAGILKLITECYRPVTPQESHGINVAYPDDVVLHKALTGLKNDGGVDSEMPLDFVITALRRFA